MTDTLRDSLRATFRQVPAAEARALWQSPDAAFIAAARPDPAWWARGQGCYFGPAYQAIAARFHGPDGSTEDDRAGREVDTALRLARAHFGKAAFRILDVPCGNGRHARAIAARGHDVIALDLQEGPLARLPPVPCAAADMRALPVATASIDLVLNLWNSFGYFAEEAEEVGVLAEFRRVLRPGGLALLHSDLDAPAVAQGRWVQHMTTPLGEGALYLQRQVPTPARDGLVCLSWVIFPGEDPWQGPAFFLRALDDAAWHRIAAAAGFRGVHLTRTPPGVVPHETIARLSP